MLFRTLRALGLVAAAMVATSEPTWAQDRPAEPAKILTITLDGALGPVLSGSDPAGLDGQSATVTITASESLKPYKTTAKSASYHIPAGDITVTVDGTNYTSTSRSSMIVKLGGKSDRLTLKASLKIDGYTVKISDTSSLQTGSWASGVLQHPALFSPSPQDLSEPDSSFTYTFFGETTVLGVTGTASDSD